MITSGLSVSVEELKSEELQALLTPGVKFPFLADALESLNDSFDREKAKDKMKIEPFPGRNTDYDTTLQEIQGLEKQIQDVLKYSSAFFFYLVEGL